MHTMKPERIITAILSAALFLGSYRGYVALFEKDAQEPEQIFPCRIDTLPEADQQQLHRRIRVRDQEELNRLLEDYLS